MDIKTLEKGNELKTHIDYLNRQLKGWNESVGIHCHFIYPLDYTELVFVNDEMYSLFKKTALDYLNAELEKVTTEFNNL